MRLRPRWWRIAAVLLGIVVLVLAAVFVPRWVQHAQSVSALEEAVEVERTAAASLATAQVRLIAAHAQVTALATLLEPVLVLDGEPIPAAATAELADGVELALSRLSTDTLPEVAGYPAPEDPWALSVDELEAAAAEAADATAVQQTGAAARIARATTAEDAAADLGTAFGEYLVEVVTAGTALLEERADASAETIGAVRSVLDILPEAETESVPTLLAGLVEDSADLIRSSNAARISDPTSAAVVVNKQRKIQPAGYAPELRKVELSGGERMHPEAADRLEAMSAALAAAHGIRLTTLSGYRSAAAQAEVYLEYRSLLGASAADRRAARSGYSEHQTGWAMDVAATAGGCSGQTCWGATTAGKWVAANAWAYGFIIRYPAGAQPTTGYDYEPWHLRYVGTWIAQDMHDRGILTLEEYFGLPKAPSY